GPYGGSRAEIDVARGDRHQCAFGGPYDHAALLIDRIERAPHSIASGLDRDRLAEPGRPLQPQPPDLAKAPAIVPDAAELCPSIRERGKQVFGAHLDPERLE